MKAVVTVLLLFAGLVNLAPVTGLLLPSQIPAAYGVAVDDPNLLVLLRHRAALFAIVGVLLVGAALRPRMRPLGCAVGLFSMLTYLLIAWLDGPTNAQLTRIAVIDLAAVGATLAAWVLDLGWLRGARDPDAA